MTLTELVINIRTAPCFAIYGAQVVAYGVFIALRELYRLVPECFVVSAAAGNPLEIDGIGVRELDKCRLEKNTLILTAVTGLLQDEICVLLDGAGFHNYLRIDAGREHLLMSAYLASAFPLLTASGNGGECDIALYEVKSHCDKPLKNVPGLEAWEHAIQAGAALTHERLALILDNTKENISAKNKQYCEMSAAYWVWKNTNHAWTGIEHYRRHLLVSPDMLSCGVDAVLPLPYMCYPNTVAQFRRFVGDDVLNALLTALKILHINDCDRYLQILNGQYQYTYNLVCAKRGVFDAYCNWLFNITEYMETLCVPEISETRALSYVSEVLTNLYFMSKTDRLSVRHAEKAIYA